MNKVLCYIINGNEVFLEQILAEYDYPILYTCIDNKRNRYLALCSDPDEGRYLVAKITNITLVQMLKDKISMVGAFKNAVQLYRVISKSDNPHDDMVENVDFPDIDSIDLPDEDAYFGLLDSEVQIQKYIELLKNENLEYYRLFERIIMIGSHTKETVKTIMDSIYFQYDSYPVVEKTMQYVNIDVNPSLKEVLVYES